MPSSRSGQLESGAGLQPKALAAGLESVVDVVKGQLRRFAYHLLAALDDRPTDAAAQSEGFGSGFEDRCSAVAAERVEAGRLRLAHPFDSHHGRLGKRPALR